jgi:hypothetical protein
MKKSEIYHFLQHVVLGTRSPVADLTAEERVEIIGVLVAEESSAKTYEKYLADKEAEEK